MPRTASARLSCDIIEYWPRNRSQIITYIKEKPLKRQIQLDQVNLVQKLQFQ